MRLVTILLAVVMVVLGALAAHHAQTVQGETSQPVVLEVDAAAQPLAGSGGAPDSPGGHPAAGLVTGCIVLIACLALVPARAGRGDLLKRLSWVTDTLRAVIGVTPTGPTFAARPDLIALSISRT
ncbi:MAG TPA: hypothetical protein VK095_03400 [Beutenbergiaceae bacterium]|uniref:hypothetical protein n=1 Tax=unclassified Georgenia TaxID=2626815 RepID=UPI002CD1748D|nr:hypothetical protein [Georgenia sp. H159]HLS13536.1 hypothetical protein [Beutenbergiaceae bacterium]